MDLNKKPQTAEEFGKLVVDITKSENYREPTGFGIARVDLGQKNKDKVLQASFPVVNWEDNLGSAAVFTAALEASGIKIDPTCSEFVTPVTVDFIEAALEMFTPFQHELEGDKHKNIQALLYLESKMFEMLNPLAFLGNIAKGILTPCSDIKAFSDKEKELINKVLKNYRVVFIYEDTEVQSAEAAYLKLYALSKKKAELRKVNLDGIFGIFANVAWVGNQPFELAWLRENEIELKFDGEYPAIDSVDKFPRFLQHVIPEDNTRILEASKVRMGAQLAAGTTVMPGASYINFNAGTLGPVMVEGRISSSAIVGAGSDVGGGASILGVLSGTDGNPISIGENTLLGANSVTGIPLGDACIVDAGITILAGTKVIIEEKEMFKILDANPNSNSDIYVVSGEERLVKGHYKLILDEKKYYFKAEVLQGLNGLHFRQDSITGKMIVRRSTREVKLNADLH